MASKPDTLGRMLDTSGKVESAYVGDLILTDLSNVNVTEGTQQIGDNLGWDLTSASMQVMNLTDTSSLKTTAEVDTSIGGLLGTPPVSLDTLSEFQTAIGNNTDFGTQFTTIQARTKSKHFIADGTQTEFVFAHEAGKVHVSVNGVQMTSEQQAGLLAPAITHDYISTTSTPSGPSPIGPSVPWLMGTSSYDNNVRIGVNYGSEADAKVDFQNVGVFDIWYIYGGGGWEHETNSTTGTTDYGDIQIFSGTNLPGGGGVDDGYNFNGDYTWRGWASWDAMDYNMVLRLHPQSGDTVGQGSGQPYQFENYKNNWSNLSNAQRQILIQPGGAGGGAGNVTSGQAEKIAFTSLVPEAGDIVTIRSY
ncbi:MAG: hypothetical protein CBC83_00625 [Flavobacteriales bacterium TMED123]|nr:MAG: hypothetical protein CBC83_00625 [Flavobacteriales bacterium TMED123]